MTPSVLTITSHKFPDVTTLPMPTCLEVSANYYTRPPGIVSLLILTITYIQSMVLHIHTQGRFNDHTACSLYRIMVTATGGMGVTKMGNTVPKAGLKPTSLALLASVLSLLNIGFMMSPIYPSHVTFVLRVRGQCRLLQ